MGEKQDNTRTQGKQSERPQEVLGKFCGNSWEAEVASGERESEKTSWRWRLTQAFMNGLD